MAGVIQIFTHRGTTDDSADHARRQTAELSAPATARHRSADCWASSTTPPPRNIFQRTGKGPGDYFRDATASGNFGWKFSDTDTLRLTLRNNASDAGQPGQTLLPGGATPGQTQRHPRFRRESGLEFLHRAALAASGVRHSNRVFSWWRMSPPFGSFHNRNTTAPAESSSPPIFSKMEASLRATKMRMKQARRASRHNQAGYLEVRYQFGTRLTAIVGGRVEANGFFGTRTVPRAGASYALRRGSGFWGATRLRASYGRRNQGTRNSAARLRSAAEAGAEHDGRCGDRSVLRFRSRAILGDVFSQ